MPSFTIDVSKQATDYVTASIKDMPGNPGQETLVEQLDIDCDAVITVNIAGQEVETEASGNIVLRSSHPEAIEQIIAAGEDHFKEFLEYASTESSSAYNGLDIIRTIRQDAIDEAFAEL